MRLKIQPLMSLKIAKVAENYSVRKIASVAESSASLRVKGVSVRAAADQNLLPLTGQRSASSAAELVDFR